MNQPGTIEAHLATMLKDAIDFDTSDRKDARERALQYLRGIMTDTPALAGRSSMTTSDVADAVSWIMPGLMRIFAGAAGVVEYEPVEEGEEQRAEDATEYVQLMFENECDGYRVLWQWFHDALTTRNGVVKWWWEDAERSRTESLMAESPEHLQAWLDQHNNPPEISDIKLAPDGVGITFTAKTILRNGRLRVEAVPPEEFLINRAARSIDDAEIVGHRCFMTRSDLIKMGYDRQMVEDLPSAQTSISNTTDDARTGYNRADALNGINVSDVVEYFEVFIKFDMNDDGIAERIRVCAAGSSNAPVILDEPEEWEDEPNFADITPIIIPHSWQGRSVADDAFEIQRVKTVLLRQTLDNLYMTNRPQRAVNVNMIENPAEVMNPTIGGTIRVKGDPRAAIYDITVPFTGEASLATLQYFDNLLQRRTGVSQSAMGLDDGSLVPQTATQSQKEHDASYSKVELIARNFSETGIKRLFRGILKTFIKHQTTPVSLKVKDKWKTFDASEWSPEMQVRVNVGLGTGTKERDLTMLRAIGMEQDKVIAQMGVDNPIVPVDKWVKLRHKMITSSGLKDADQYFADIDPEKMAAWQASRPQQPDPKMVAVQAKANTDQMAAQGKLALQEKEIDGKLALKAQEINAETQLSAIQIAAGSNNSGLTNIRNVN